MGGRFASSASATDERAALEAAVRDHAAGGYAIATVKAARCTCGGEVFHVRVDDEEGVAERKCIACDEEVLLADSAEYIDDASPEECECPCGKDAFRLAVGFALTQDATDVRWISFGLRCTACGLAGVYADWKIDYGPSLHLLDKV